MRGNPKPLPVVGVSLSPPHPHDGSVEALNFARGTKSKRALRSMVATFRETDYHVIIKELAEEWGLCNPPWFRKPTMTINPFQTDYFLLVTLIHESLHACLWDIDEDAIDESSRSIADLLWRMGLRFSRKRDTGPRKAKP
jgi:hypothetical protein